MMQQTEIVKTPHTFQEALSFFSEESRYMAYLVKMRWPQGVTCPICGSAQVHDLATQRCWKCKTPHARQQFSIKVGTAMEASPIPLTKWLPALWMLTNCKQGLSSYELHRVLQVTQKTAWFMGHRVRCASQVEATET